MNITLHYVCNYIPKTDYMKLYVYVFNSYCEQNWNDMKIMYSRCGRIHDTVPTGVVTRAYWNWVVVDESEVMPHFMGHYLSNDSNVWRDILSQEENYVLQLTTGIIADVIHWCIKFKPVFIEKYSVGYNDIITQNNRHNRRTYDSQIAQAIKLSCLFHNPTSRYFSPLATHDEVSCKVSHFDYCNSLLCGSSHANSHKLYSGFRMSLL